MKCKGDTYTLIKMSKLLFLIVVSSFLATCPVEATLHKSELGPKIQEIMDTLHSTCVSKSGVDEVSIEKVAKGEFIDESKIKDYMKCLLAESGVIDEIGNFNMEILAHLLPIKYMKEAIENVRMCDAKIKASGIAIVEDKIFAFFKCLYDKSPDIFIFF